MGKQELVGHVGVDAGLVWVGDPCYVMGDDATSRVTDWSDFCDLLDGSMAQEPLGDGTGLAISSGWGDGCYPVYVEYMEEGRVSSIHVYFDRDPNRPDEDR